MNTIKKMIAHCFLTALILVSTVCVFHSTVYAATVSVKTEDALVSAVAKGGGIKLTADIELNGILTVPSGITVSIDLNGKTLSRNLTSNIDNGGIILVEPDASLTITDGTGNNAGTITGGKSFDGGGVCNYGALYFEGGTISGNEAENGGGIYNSTNATLYLRGGIIRNNEAGNLGGGVCNVKGGSLTVEQYTVVKKKGVSSVTYNYNVTVTNNTAKKNGDGIYNADEMKIGGVPEIFGNGNCDVYLTSGKKITFTSEIASSQKISVKTTGTNPVITKDYSKYMTKKPSEVFTSCDTTYVPVFSSADNGEVMLKNDSKTVVQVFEKGKIVKREETDSKDFVNIWNTAIGYSKDNTSVWGAIKDDSVVEITLGRDYSYDSPLYINPYRNIVLDLNGHYIKRAGKKQKDGYLFKVGESAKFTINDSNPNSDGYDEIKGGVITGGAGDDCGGGIIVQKRSRLYMNGGTVYQCTTDYHGGAVYAGEDFAYINMKDCTIDSCQTKDSGDDCHGGGIYVKNSSNVILNNVTFKNCKSEDKGGALYLREKPRNVDLKNCLFAENFANDGGGAIFIDDLKSDTAFTFEAENCFFTKNKANADGGAVYINDDDEYEPPKATVFRECTFTENESTKDGGAMEVNDNGVVLFGGTLNKNKAGGKGGAIYVEGEYDISVAGKLIIKGNDGKDNYDNLCLEENSNHKAYVYDAGLYKGSEIYLSTSNNKNKIAGVKDVSKYQTQYFHPEKGKLEFNKTGEKEAKMITTASLFSSGSLIIILALSGIAVCAVAAAVVIKKKKGVAENDDDDEE